MRFVLVALFGIILGFSTQAFAQATPPSDGSASSGTGMSFGVVNCDDFVACTPDATTLPAMIASATRCLGRHFGSNGSYDASTTLDGNNCLTAPQNAAENSGSGYALSSQCCVVQGINSTCHMQCQQIGHK